MKTKGFNGKFKKKDFNKKITILFKSHYTNV